MEIELSEDLQHYKESIAMGLNVKQLIYSVLSIGAGAGTVLLLYDKIGITASCYVATPIVAPLALTGFYNYNGLTFWQHMKNHWFFFFQQTTGFLQSCSRRNKVGVSFRRKE